MIEGYYQIEQPGPAAQLLWHDATPIDPGPGEVLVQHSAIGLNYIDVYHRSGLYPLPLPSRLGVEAAGVVVAVGSNVKGWQPGDRIAYAMGLGAYGTFNTVPAGILVAVPDAISDDLAAASLLKGLTVSYLLRKTHALQAGETILVHAAAGGVGLILCQWARHLGATVIATAGSMMKAELAAANGAHHTIVYGEEDVAERVREITSGNGVRVVYDSVGEATYHSSLNSLAPLGMFVSYGSASGKIAGVDPQDLMARGSLFFTRPSLAAYAAQPEDLAELAASLFAVLDSGAVNVHIKQRYPLTELMQAHIDLEARLTTGSTIILPNPGPGEL